MYKTIFGLIALLCCTPILAQNVISEGKSPDNTLTLEILTDSENTICYQVNRGADKIVEKSRLGISTSLEDFTSGLIFESASTDIIDESYTLPFGKKQVYTDKCTELKTVFRKSEKKIEIIFRIYNEGIAYRYALSGSGEISIFSETSENQIADIKRIYSQTYSKNYRNSFEENEWDVMSCLRRSSLPVLVETTGDNYLLLTEAMVNGNYAAAKFTADEISDAFVYELDATVKTSLPFRSPWRILLMGKLENIVESTLPDNLNDASAYSDLSWIKPGKATWNYGGEDTSGYLDLDNIKEYIDLAQEMGWEYFTLDKGWQNKSGLSLNQVLNYAKTKSVGIFIWVNQAFLSANEATMRNTLRSWSTLGVKGLKVDFWESDSQETMKKYDLLFKLSAEQKLLLNLHSCTKPTGLRRTWPHLLTSEAVTGNVYYARSPEVVSAVHNINSAIIRGTLGATDYTPVDFAEKNGRLLQGVTWAHQLALPIIFESGIQHIMESPDNLKYSVGKEFLKTLPVAWDNTKCVEATPDEFISIARKKGDDWYLAALTNEARTRELSLGFLTAGKSYNAYIYKDGGCPSEIAFKYIENLKSDDKLSITLLSQGGVAICLSPSSDYAKPGFLKFEAESENNLIPFGLPVKTDKDSLCSGGKYVDGIGKGRPLTFQKIKVPAGGTYALTIYYMADSQKSAYLKINGNDASTQTHSFTNTGKETGSGLAQKTVLVELNGTGENTIEFGNDTEYAPAIDRITIADWYSGGTNITIPTVAHNGKIYVEHNHIIIEQEGSAEYSVYNSLGQLLHQGHLNDNSISIPVGTAGLYIVRIKSENGEYAEKVIL